MTGFLAPGLQYERLNGVRTLVGKGAVLCIRLQQELRWHCVRYFQRDRSTFWQLFLLIFASIRDCLGSTSAELYLAIRFPCSFADSASITSYDCSETAVQRSSALPATLLPKSEPPSPSVLVVIYRQVRSTIASIAR